jgi:hypothetical protein
MHRSISAVLIIAFAFFGCGRADDTRRGVAAGVSSLPHSEAGSVGDFLAYPGGKTGFQLGKVNPGAWHEPDRSNGPGGGGPMVRRRSINIATPPAADPVTDPLNRIDVQRRIAALLLNIRLADIDKPKVGANYNYYNFCAGAAAETMGAGCAGGHTGVDFQTKDVAGTATADRDVFSLTDGEVIETDPANGKVFVRASLRGDGADEQVEIGYLHLRKVSVAKGDRVTRGETKIGVQGNNGLSLPISDTNTREHVHVEIRPGTAPAGTAYGVSQEDKHGKEAAGALDPQKYFATIVGKGVTPKWIARMTN